MITHCHRRSPRWRFALWGAALLLLAAPWVAMQFGGEANWDFADFVLFGGMLVIACGSFELAARFISNQLTPTNNVCRERRSYVLDLSALTLNWEVRREY